LLVSESTKQGLQQLFVFRPIDKVRVKGKSAAVSLYEPVCTCAVAGQALQDEIHSHEQALQAYYDGKWQEAIDQFKSLKSQYQHQRLYDIFLQRLESMTDTNDPHWDGVYTHLEK